jgi:hypothetical protein
VAQVVNFHQYPKKISFDADDSYVTYTRNINIDGDSGTADFPSFSELNSMLSNIDYNEESESYAPALNFACGIIVEMDYSSSGSGAHFDAEDFTVKLQYKDAVKKMGNEPDFYGILEEDMKARRPAMIAIHQGGYVGYHAIVVDGYRSTGEYHLNFGWGESFPDEIQSCWYLLPSGMPVSYSVVEYGVLSITAPDLNPYNQYKHAVSYPSPFNLSQVGKVTIAMPERVDGVIDKLRIYTVTGELVREISGGDLYVEWDGRNNQGKKCVAGIYFYSIKSTENEKHRGKIIIVD